MKVFTFQHSKVLEVLAMDGVYYPNFGAKPKYMYDYMRPIYPVIQKLYENKNNVQCDGLVFTFSLLSGLPIKNYGMLYEFFCENPLVSCAYHFWNPEYLVIEMDIPDTINTVSIGVNDFIKLAMYEAKDVSGMRNWELLNGISFEDEIRTIIYKLKNDKLHDQTHVQSHIHYISVDDIINIYPSFNYKDGQLYEFSVFNQHNATLDQIMMKKGIK